jgi:Zn-dependent M28 family amino/carboxypeptidase
MTSVADDEPHTGNMSYDTLISGDKIPAVALGYKSASLLHETLQKDPSARLYLKTNCVNLEPVISHNVVGQINGTQDAGGYFVAGGHLDSWDLGQGAHDDGAGIVHSIAVLEAFKRCGIRPQRSIRAVAFMNEENGLAGGEAYARLATERKERHLAAVESDAGGFVPRGFGVDTARGLYDAVIAWNHIFSTYMVDHFEPEGGGADLMALEKLGVPCIGFIPDTQRYFDIHHTAADTFDKINKRELELGGAAIAALIYLLDRNYIPR